MIYYFYLFKFIFFQIEEIGLFCVLFYSCDGKQNYIEIVGNGVRILFILDDVYEGLGF